MTKVEKHHTIVLARHILTELRGLSHMIIRLVPLHCNRSMVYTNGVSFMLLNNNKTELHATAEQGNSQQTKCTCAGVDMRQGINFY